MHTGGCGFESRQLHTISRPLYDERVKKLPADGVKTARAAYFLAATVFVLVAGLAAAVAVAAVRAGHPMLGVAAVAILAAACVAAWPDLKPYARWVGTGRVPSDPDDPS